MTISVLYSRRLELGKLKMELLFYFSYLGVVKDMKEIKLQLERYVELRASRLLV